jgi:hypothetical protein
MFKISIGNMLNDFEQGNHEAAESMAAELLGWARLPLLYRAYCHIVSYATLEQISWSNSERHDDFVFGIQELKGWM